MPKTIKNIYDNSISFENLLKAHKKSKMWKKRKEKNNIVWVKTRIRIIGIRETIKKWYIQTWWLHKI